MKQCSIEGISVNYSHYGEAILLIGSIESLGISNGLLIPYTSIIDGVFEWKGNKYTIKFD